MDTGRQLLRGLLKAGAEYLAVATADEAVDLREAGITAPILVLGTSFPGAARINWWNWI